MFANLEKKTAMAIITSRTKEKGTIHINYEKCIGCGLCVEICKDFSLKMEDEKPVINNRPLFGCIGCGHCMAVCPSDAIFIEGREISASDLINLPPDTNKSSYAQLNNLMIGRRSIRDFKKKPVERELIQKIIDIAVTAPVGIPPSDVHLLVFDGAEKVSEFAFDVIDHIQKIKWVFSKTWVWLWRLFGKEAYEMMKGFGQPLANFFVEKKATGEDYLLYHAPLAMYFLASPYSDPADPMIPATYAMLAAESLGLGSCMIGSVDPMIKHGAKDLKKKWNIPLKSPNGIIVIFGYPKYKFTKALKRTFANVTVYEN